MKIGAVLVDHWKATQIRGKPLTIITNRSILDVAAALDPPL